MIFHSPAQLIGDLATAGGQFATGMDVANLNLRQQQVGMQGQAQQAQQQLERDRMDQQSQLQRESFAHADDELRLRDQLQGQHDTQDFENRKALQQQNFELQGSNQANLANLNNQAREDRAGMRDDTTRYGIDQRTGLGYDRLDASTQQAQQRADIAERKLEDQIANRQARGDPAQAQAFKQAVFAQKQKSAQFRAQTDFLNAGRRNLMAERDALTSQIGQTFGKGQDAVRAKIATLNGDIAANMRQYEALLTRGAMGQNGAAAPNSDGSPRQGFGDPQLPTVENGQVDDSSDWYPQQQQQQQQQYPQQAPMQAQGSVSMGMYPVNRDGYDQHPNPMFGGENTVLTGKALWESQRYGPGSAVGIPTSQYNPRGGMSPWEAPQTNPAVSSWDNGGGLGGFGGAQDFVGGYAPQSPQHPAVSMAIAIKNQVDGEMPDASSEERRSEWIDRLMSQGIDPAIFGE